VASAVTLGVLIAVFVYWYFLSSRDPTLPQRTTIECRAFYANAETSADTARVDLLHPAMTDHEDPNLPSCGTLRRLGLLEVDPSKPPQN
jgi:hypothetical protein